MLWQNYADCLKAAWAASREAARAAEMAPFGALREAELVAEAAWSAAAAALKALRVAAAADPAAVRLPGRHVRPGPFGGSLHFKVHEALTVVAPDPDETEESALQWALEEVCGAEPASNNDWEMVPRAEWDEMVEAVRAKIST